MSILKKISAYLKHRLRPIIHLPYSGRIPQRGRVLMIYNVKAFENPKSELMIHSNRQEALVIANAFMTRGYQVDVKSYHSRLPVQWSNYDIVFGFGDAFEASFHEGCTAKRIYYSTTAALCWQAQAETKRLQRIEKAHGIKLRPRRATDRQWPASLGLSDAIFTTGNAWTQKTLEMWDRPIFRTPVSCLSYWSPNAVDGNYLQRRNGFLWFGGRGAVHKGLDLVLEARAMIDAPFDLHICGPLTDEKDFWNLYKNALEQDDHVINHGFVNYRCEAFRDILRKCAFTIMPSCSEGGCSGVLTCMASGLVPVVTESASVDMHDCGILIEDATPEATAIAICKALSLPEKIYNSLSARSVESINTHHTLDAFSRSFCAALDSTIG